MARNCCSAVACVLLVVAVVNGTTDGWYSCPVHTYPGTKVPNDPLPPSVTVTADCNNVSVPLDHTKPDGKRITLFVKRVNALQQPAAGELWLLQGGPGGSGVIMEMFVEPIFSLVKNYNIIIPDHRGTGRSTGLACATPTNMSKCGQELLQQWGADGLAMFSTTQAAQDMAYVMKKYPAEQTFVYGASYGTYWANRFMVLNPSLATGVIVDGLCPPDLCSIDMYYDPNANIVASELLTLCGAQSDTCRKWLGDMPYDKVQQLELQWRQNTLKCKPWLESINVTLTSIKKSFFGFLTDRDNRLLIGPVVARMMRCSDQDKADIISLGKYLATGLGPMPLSDNALLGYNILCSELATLWNNTGVSLEARMAALDVLTVAAGIEVGNGIICPTWPKYDPNQQSGYRQFPNTTIPVLITEGSLDPQTLHAQADYYAATMKKLDQHVTYFTVPNDVHCAERPNILPVEDAVSCGIEILASFMQNPNAPNGNCTRTIPKLDFEGTGAGMTYIAQKAFNKPNMWPTDQ